MSNNMNWVQFGVNKQPMQFCCVWKIYWCLFKPNFFWIHISTYTNSKTNLKKIAQINDKRLLWYVNYMGMKLGNTTHLTYSNYDFHDR